MHTIRLRGPWDCKKADDGSQGPLRCARRFNRPTGLTDAISVWLVLDPLPCPADVQLNAAPLGSVPGRFEVGRLLLPRNEIVVTLEYWSGELPETIEGVRLEIEE